MSESVDWVEVTLWCIYGLILCGFLYTESKNKTDG